jgi:MoxR-like ATPase
VHIEPKLKQYILNIVRATRDPHEAGLPHANLVQMGGSPRATIALLVAAKAQAMIMGRHYVIPQDVRDIVHEILRHRIYLNFQAKMENINTDTIVNEIIDAIKIY